MEEPEDPSGDRRHYWRRGVSTARHVYYTPADNRAGITLFVLIAVLGMIALAISIWHLSMTSAVQGKDVTLACIGGGLSVLGVVQGWRLWREP